MAGTTERIALKKDEKEDRLVEYTEIFTIPGATSPLRFQRTDDGVHLQLSGSATDIEVIVERCTNDPGGVNANWAPVMPDPIEGDLSLGIAPFCFREPSRAFWRARVTTITGGNIILVLTGEQA